MELTLKKLICITSALIVIGVVCFIAFVIYTSTKIKKIGKWTYGAHHIRIKRYHKNDGKLIIGNFCSIADNVTVFLGNGLHQTQNISTFPFDYPIGARTFFGIERDEERTYSKGDVVIGHDVWIGINSTIMHGVTIGNGAVIASNSHVISDVPAYAIVGGNPAKIIKMRFTDEQIKDIESLEWWDWPISAIRKASNYLNSPIGNNMEELKLIKSSLQ